MGFGEVSKTTWKKCLRSSQSSGALILHYWGKPRALRDCFKELLQESRKGISEES